VYPVFETATQPARAVVDQWLRQLPGILAFGRQGLGVPDNLHHVLAMGSAVAEAIDGGRQINNAAWRTSLADFATNVVQD